MLSLRPTLKESEIDEFYVTREKMNWILDNDRDVEELSGNCLEPWERETLYVKLNSVVNVEQQPNRLNLREFPLPRAWLPIVLPDYILSVLESDIPCLGHELIQSMRHHGYFKIRLSEQTMRTVNETFRTLIDFFDLPADDKLSFAGSTHSRLAPYFGYRATSLQKEFFVYRNTDLFAVPAPIAPLQVGFESLGGLLQGVMRSILQQEFLWPESEIEASLRDMLSTIADQSALPFSTFLEVFKYDCKTAIPAYQDGLRSGDERYRILCGEHRDCSLLTIVPRCQGTVTGLELYDWSLGAWVRVEDALQPDEAVVFPGEYFALFTSSPMPACCHRVVVPINRLDGVRYSCPYELTPFPTPEVQKLMSSLGKGLVSVNY
jgi:isopenicillin N synthase-like dioxygenase